MKESAGPSQLERELRELRARAYGPHPDIQDDPEALARLAELESFRLRERKSTGLDEHESQEPAQFAPETAGADEAPMSTAGEKSAEHAWPTSLWRDVTTTPTGRFRLIVGCVAVIIAVVYAVTWFGPPKPEATLRPTGLEADSRTLSAVSHGPLHEVDRTTLRGYEPFRSLHPWVAENAQGSRCLVVTEGSTLHGIRCAPHEAELIIDIGAFPLDYTAAFMEGLADGSVIRFQLRGDSVDAYVYSPPTAD